MFHIYAPLLQCGGQAVAYAIRSYSIPMTLWASWSVRTEPLDVVETDKFGRVQFLLQILYSHICAPLLKCYGQAIAITI